MGNPDSKRGVGEGSRAVKNKISEKPSGGGETRLGSPGCFKGRKTAVAEVLDGHRARL